MRALTIFLAATALLTAASAAQADTGSIEPLHATAQQMDQATGSFRLSDGRRADVYVLDNRLYMKIGSGPQKQLELTGPDSFATRDGKISIRFRAESGPDRMVLAQDSGIAIRPDAIRLASNERTGHGGTN